MAIKTENKRCKERKEGTKFKQTDRQTCRLPCYSPQ